MLPLLPLPLLLLHSYDIPEMSSLQVPGFLLRLRLKKKIADAVRLFSFAKIF